MPILTDLVLPVFAASGAGAAIGTYLQRIVGRRFARTDHFVESLKSMSARLVEIRRTFLDQRLEALAAERKRLSESEARARSLVDAWLKAYEEVRIDSTQAPRFGGASEALRVEFGQEVGRAVEALMRSKTGTADRSNAHRDVVDLLHERLGRFDAEHKVLAERAEEIEKSAIARLTEDIEEKLNALGR